MPSSVRLCQLHQGVRLFKAGEIESVCVWLYEIVRRGVRGPRGLTEVAAKTVCSLIKGGSVNEGGGTQISIDVTPGQAHLAARVRGQS